MFEDVQQAMSERAPKVQRPGRVGSKFLLSGLLKCGVCGRPYSAQRAKSGQFAYYICGTLFREGAGTCSARYLNAPRLEAFVVEKIRERILTKETIVELVTLVAEEIDAMAGELSGRLEVIEAELGDVRERLERLYEAIETSELTPEVLSPRIMSLRHGEEQLEAAREDAMTQLEQRRVELPNTEEIARYVADFRDFLQEGTIPERKALIRTFASLPSHPYLSAVFHHPVSAVPVGWNMSCYRTKRYGRAVEWWKTRSEGLIRSQEGWCSSSSSELFWVSSCSLSLGLAARSTLASCQSLGVRRPRNTQPDTTPTTLWLTRGSL